MGELGWRDSIRKRYPLWRISQWEREMGSCRLRQAQWEDMQLNLISRKGM